MSRYQITNTGSGMDLGTYEADSAQGALDAMSRDAGYRDHADACDVTSDGGSDLVVAEIGE